MLGSSLKFCKIAEGEANVYLRFGTTMEWDTAAGQAIVEATGGSVIATDEDKHNLLYNKKSMINPDFICLGGIEKKISFS
jgi:3'(2'), 5'-bisphosphate nucleotidase